MPKLKTRKQRDCCFVIMPFGGWFDSYYEDIYIPAIEAAGLEPKRADDLFRPSPIINDIWSMTKGAKLILADLSKKNPNVFYELGLAHALSKPAVLVSESILDVPFDLQSLRVIVYNKDEPDWGATLGKKIKNSILEVIKSPENAVLPTFLSAKDQASKPSVTPQELELMTLRQELEGLRREVSLPQMRPSFDRVLELDPDERIRHYLKMGMPKPFIVRRMAQRGFSREFVESRLERFIGPRRVIVAKKGRDEPKKG